MVKINDRIFLSLCTISCRKIASIIRTSENNKHFHHTEIYPYRHWLWSSINRQCSTDHFARAIVVHRQKRKFRRTSSVCFRRDWNHEWIWENGDSMSPRRIRKRFRWFARIERRRWFCSLRFKVDRKELLCFEKWKTAFLDFDFRSFDEDSRTATKENNQENSSSNKKKRRREPKPKTNSK